MGQLCMNGESAIIECTIIGCTARGSIEEISQQDKDPESSCLMAGCWLAQQIACQGHSSNTAGHAVVSGSCYHNLFAVAYIEELLFVAKCVLEKNRIGVKNTCLLEWCTEGGRDGTSSHGGSIASINNANSTVYDYRVYIEEQDAGLSPSYCRVYNYRMYKHRWCSFVSSQSVHGKAV